MASKPDLVVPDRVSRHPAYRERYGPWAVVTGASSGIGRACAERLASEQMHLVLVARNTPALHAHAAELTATYGIETEVVAADLSSPSGPDLVRRQTEAVDVGLFIAAAGFGTSGPFLDVDLAAEQAMLDVNCGAVLALTHVYARRFAARGGGGVVLFGSLVGMQGSPLAAHYAATKAWVRTLGEALTVELRPHHVDVLVSSPGPVQTGFAARARMQMSAATTPEVVARVTLAALGRRSVVTPGPLSRVLTLSLQPLPRRARVRIMGRVMAGMTRPHSSG